MEKSEWYSEWQKLSEINNMALRNAKTESGESLIDVLMRKKDAAKRIIGAFSLPEGVSPNESLEKEMEMW